MDQIEQAHSFNLSLPAFSTPDVPRVWDRINAAQFFNEHRSMGGRRLVVVDAPSHWGKTTAVLALGLKQHRVALAQAEPDSPHPRPWAYVLASAQGKGRALSQGILRFLGIPFGPSETAATLVDRLAALAPQIGLHTVFIDDVHFLKGSGPNERFAIANVLKHLVSTVPVTFVLAGVNLAGSPMLARSGTGTTPADQLASRADWLHLKPWPKANAEGDLTDAWRRLVANLAAQLYLPHGAQQYRLNEVKTAQHLIDGSRGLPGTAIEWTIRAANHAIQEDRPLDRQALRATAS